jgi:mono/diheme cytochrome c family protein
MRLFLRLGLGLILTLAAPLPLCAAQVGLSAPAAMVDTGIFAYVLPRFWIRSQIDVRVVGADTDAPLRILPAPAAEPAGGQHRPLMADAERTYDLVLAPDAPAPARAFFDWATSPAGLRAITGFERAGRQVFFPPKARSADQPEVVAPGTIAEGERLALCHCGRCHVINDKNRFDGIGSTPSFGALRALPDAKQRFDAFWTFNPHPSFMQVEGQTAPFDPAHPPSVAPVILTQQQAEAIAAFADSLKPLDLGAPVRPR